MMLEWNDFKEVLGQNPTIEFNYNELGKFFHLYVEMNAHVIYECLIKKYLEPSADQIDFETNYLI